MTAWVTFSPRWASAASLSLRRIMAEISGGEYCLPRTSTRASPLLALMTLRDDLELLEHLVVATPHEPLDREHGVLGIRDRLPLGHLADENLAFLREPHDRGCQPTALLVRD